MGESDGSRKTNKKAAAMVCVKMLRAGEKMGQPGREQGNG